MILEEAEGTVVVDSFLLSCRALGRGVEHQMLAHLGKWAVRSGAQWVHLPFEQLPRNQPVLDFLQSIGAPFRKESGGSYQFHFPAQVAAEIVFHPQGPAPAARAETEKETRPATGPGKFAFCRNIALESLDLKTLHAKIESQATARTVATGAYAAPRNELERQLCALWQKLLRVERVGISDDFFELGGHSLLAVRFFAEVEKLTGKKLPLITLFQAPTIAELGLLLGKSDASDLLSLLVPVQPQGQKPPLYLVHGAGGDVLWGYANLVAHLDPDQPVYALKSRGQSGLDEFERLEDMAACYLQVVRAKQPAGPYCLGGYCFGGNVAYEMARQLEASGEQVALLALLDSAPANAGYGTVQWWRPDFPYRFSCNLYYWLRDFRAVPPRDRRRFMARKLRAFSRKLARWTKGSAKDEAVDLEEVIDPAQFPESELKLWKLHLRALEKHVQQPYRGPVALFRTRGHPLFCSFARDLRWGRLARGGVAVKIIPGSHENIFMEPNVKSLALGLTVALSQAQARAEKKNESVLLPS
jgi:thioesterase domain-containing protein